jgi:hypothetical protein
LSTILYSHMYFKVVLLFSLVITIILKGKVTLAVILSSLKLTDQWSMFLKFIRAKWEFLLTTAASLLVSAYHLISSSIFYSCIALLVKRKTYVLLTFYFLLIRKYLRVDLKQMYMFNKAAKFVFHVYKYVACCVQKTQIPVENKSIC